MVVAQETTSPPAAPAAQEWTRALFEAIDDAVFVHDSEGNILEANPAACRRLGYSREELLRLKTRDIDDPEFAAGFADRLSTQLEQAHFRCQGRHRHKDGTIIPVDINTSVIQIDGKPAVLAVMRDIAALKETEDQLARQTALLQSVLDHMGDAVLVADQNKQLLAFNPAAARTFGLERRRALGTTLGGEGLYLPDKTTPYPAGQTPLDRALRGEIVDDAEVYLRRAGTIAGAWLSVTAQPLRDDQGAVKGGVLVCRDVSEAKRAARRQSVQLAVARALAESISVEESVRRVLEVLCQHLGLDAGVLWVPSADEETLACQEVWLNTTLSLEGFLGRTRSARLTQSRELPWLAWQRRTAQALHFENRLDMLPQRYAVAYQDGLRWGFAFPLEGPGRVSGILEFLTRSGARIEDDLLPLIKTISGQVGQVLEHQRMQTALRDSESLYHSLVDCLPQNIFRKDRQGRVSFGNSRYTETLKMPLEALLGKTDFDLFPPHLAAKYVEDDRRVMEAGVPFEAVEEHRTPDGKRLFVQVVKTPTYDAQGNVNGIQGIFWDVTEKTLSEERLADSERRYRQLAEATLDGIVLIDHEGTIKLFNPSAERMFGYAAAEVVGKNVKLLIPPSMRPAHEKGLARYLETREGRLIGKTVEVQAVHKDGTEFPVEIALSVVSLAPPGPDGKEPLQFLGALRDLTERNKMRSVLVQNEKLASIGLLSAGVAHEINNPLAFVGNNLVVLERDVKGLLSFFDLVEMAKEKLQAVDPRLAEALRLRGEELDLAYTLENLPRLMKRTRDGVDRVTRIVHSLRGLARTETPKQQEVLLPDLVDNSLEILHGRFKHSGIEVTQEHDANPRVTCVSTQISQVILNLLLNAFQALESHLKQGGKIRVRTWREGGNMNLEVADNGPGIAAENKDKLFDPFFTTKDVGEGTGLGLSICHNIVQAHGGTLDVESRPGAGASFRVALPLTPTRIKT